MADAITAGYSALTIGAGIVDLSARGRIRVSRRRPRPPAPRATDHVQQLKPGEGLVSSQRPGRIQADAHMLSFEDHLLLDTQPKPASPSFNTSTGSSLPTTSLSKTSPPNTCLGLEGPKAGEIAGAAALPAPRHHGSHVRLGGRHGGADLVHRSVRRPHLRSGRAPRRNRARPRSRRSLREPAGRRSRPHP